MAMRRPRVKVAANLSIRRPTKATSSTGSATDVKPAVPEAAPKPKAESVKKEPTKEETRRNSESDDGKESGGQTVSGGTKEEAQSPPLGDKTPTPTVEQSAFKFPKPVEEPPRITTPAPASHGPLEINTEEPHSPKKLDSKFAYINALNSPRKRIRTESMTSNKSYSDVSLKSRKTTKQEASQKASDAKRDHRRRLNNIQNVDKQSLTMFDMIYYNPVKNPMKSPAISKKGSLENIPHTVNRESRASSVSKSRSPTPGPARMPPPPPPADPPKPAVQLTPQLKLGPNGEMILDETSLVVENEREREMRDTLAKSEVVYMDEFSGNSGYYSRYKRTRDWPPEETIRFYRCLHTIGTDFSMMMQLFPNRSRRDLKLKFKKEERLNLKLVNKALLFPKEFNIEELKEQFQEEDEQMERQREQERQLKAEAEQKLLQQKLAKKMQLHQNKTRNPKKRVSKAARVMLNDERLMKTEPLIKESKPRRRRRKAAAKQEQDEEEEEQQPRPESRHSAVPDDDDVFNDAANDDHDESDQEPIVESVPETIPAEESSAPYVPNGEEAAEPAPTTNSEAESVRVSPVLLLPPSVPSPLETSDGPLDIESMDISIIDEEARSLYEIKAEPKVQPVSHFEVTSSYEPSAPSVITIQNLDDQSQTTVVYQEPEVVPCEEPAAIGLESAESKYFEGCRGVYIPMPVNAPIAHPVKTEPIAARVQPETVHPVPDTFASVYSEVGAASVDTKPVLQPSDDHQPDTEAMEEPLHVQLEPEEPQEELSPKSEKKEQLDSVEEKPPKDEQNPAQAPPPEPVIEAETEEQEPRGLGPLEDIDINSLVLVESQDTTDPNKTIYEIYVVDAETGKLSEKPLDVPEDVIENIRSILEVGGED